MKIATTNKGVLKFNGNCKSSRIKGALCLTESNDPVITTLLTVKGVFTDGANIRRYANKISNANKDHIKVSN